MIVESIKLDHFRNYESLDLEFDPGTNLFYGDNAQGKTNILEAVYLCGTTRSHRGSKDRDMIQFSGEEAHIRMQIRKDEVPYRIDMHLKKYKSKGIAINGMPVRRAAELVGLGSYIFFSPEDLNIIKNGPSERRKFLDMELCQLDKIYLFNLSSYNKVLAQRNRLLKDYAFSRDADSVLDVLDLQMVKFGSMIIKLRRDFSKKLDGLIGRIHGNLSGGRETLTLVYENDVEEAEFPEKLAATREKDIKMKFSGVGPHRDDLCFMVDDTDIRRFGSQGQQRTAALSLKLSEIEIVKQSTSETPVLLLDDVLSELDGNRQRYLLDHIHDIQTMITCTGVDDFVKNNFQIDKTFYVCSGQVEAVNVKNE
ncbi:MAG: DNA replication/repair protein RecF [Lachnospiraceae bacterium]|nr:DNA replication/repair protein RecF [Lachnospiraceae bacterium]